MEPTHQEYKYFAFISYNSKDMEWGKRIQRKLEHYRMPATLCSERGWKRKPISPIFFAPTDIQGGGLSAELQARLRASRNLIVVCSPNSAKSEWVGKEIEFFHNLGRTDHLHFFIVDGIPHSGNSDTECFNPVVKKLGIPEILGNNIHEKIYRWPWLNKERAYVQLISKLLGVEFDSIWQRHKRMLAQQLVACVIGFLCVIAALAAVWAKNQPVDVSVTLHEQLPINTALPPLHDAVVTLHLDKEKKTDTIRSNGHCAVFANIPQRYLGKEVRVTVNCADFLTTDTTLLMSRNMKAGIKRNPAVYGDIFFTLWDTRRGKPIANSAITVAGRNVQTDSRGRVKMQIPTDSQQTSYKVKFARPLYHDTVNMPCGENDVIRTDD